MGLFDAIGDAFDDAADAVEDFATDVGDAVGDALDAAGDAIDSATDAAAGVLEGIPLIGSGLAGAVRWVGGAADTFFHRAGEATRRLFNYAGQFLAGAIQLVGGILSGSWPRIVTGFRRMFVAVFSAIAYILRKLREWLFAPRMPKGTVKHVFVLMLENRSFDHLLGFSLIPDLDGLTGEEENPWGAPPAFKVKPSASNNVPVDIPHEFDDIGMQLTGVGVPGVAFSYAGKAVNNKGFVYAFAQDRSQACGTKSGPPKPEHLDLPMRCHAADCVPVLRALANEFVVCDQWYSSIPGPTWPNRFFVHAASSGGLANSPALAAVVGTGVNLYPQGGVGGPGLRGFTFKNGTVFDRLEQGDFAWRVYHGDGLPQITAIDGMAAKYVASQTAFGIALNPTAAGTFAPMESFERDLKDPDFPYTYVFIEPNYDSLGDPGYATGNSQHPLGSVIAGEKLIKKVYEAVRNSPHWDSSMLIVTYDEHGGFYDHRTPPSTAVPPGDDNRNRDMAECPRDFAFRIYGVRVPAIVIGPWVRKRNVDHVTRDHTSILAELRRICRFKPLTNRDALAESFEGLFDWTQKRADCPVELPEARACDGPTVETSTSANKPLSASHEPEEKMDGNLAGFVGAAALIERERVRQVAGVMPVALPSPVGGRAEAVRFLNEVSTRIRELRLKQRDDTGAM